MFFFRVVIRSCSKISSCASLWFPRRLGAKSETAEESIAADGPSRGFGFVQHSFGKKKRDTRKAVSNVSKKRAPDKATSSHHRGSGTIAASVSSRLALAPLSGLRRVASRVSARVRAPQTARPLSLRPRAAPRLCRAVPRPRSTAAGRGRRVAPRLRRLADYAASQQGVTPAQLAPV